MSNYSGPGLYEIIPKFAMDKSLNIRGGGSDKGLALILYERGTGKYANAQFEIVAAGGTGAQPEKGDREYHIIANNSGLYLTWPTGNSGFTQDLKKPTDAAIRFKLDNSGPDGSFYINSIDGARQLNVHGGVKEDGTALIAYAPTVAENTQFILRAVKP